MRSRSRRTVDSFLLTVGLLCGSMLLFFYAYDPLTIFHAPWGRAASFHVNMRLQAAGIINNFDFDSVILGTSMLENTSGEEAGRLFGGRFVNISITASDYFERARVLRYVFRRKPGLRNVIYSLDAGVYGRRGHPEFPPETFEFLYDRNRLNDFRAYATPNFLRCAIHLSRDEACVGRPVSLDRPNAWYRMPEQARRFGGLENWFAAENDWQIKAALASISTDAKRIAARAASRPTADEIDAGVKIARDYVQEYVLTIVAAHPETNFYLFFPPYSRIRFAQMYQLDEVAAYVHEAMCRYLAARADVLPNLHLYGFEDQDFLDDIANYKDTAHYHVGIDSMILKAMADGKNRLRGDNVEAYLAVARRKAMAFDLVRLGARIDRYLAASTISGNAVENR